MEVQQEVKVLSSLSELLSIVLPGDVVCLDLDETLISPEPDASEPWAVRVSSVLEKQGIGPAGAWAVACTLWQSVQGVCSVCCPEGATTRAVLLELQARSIEMVGLTARGPEVAMETEVQLKKCGIHGILGFKGGSTDEALSLGALALADASYAPAPLVPLTHLKGIVFCSGSRKPEGFFRYEAARRASPARRVILVDDRESHLHALAAEMKVVDTSRIGNMATTRVCWVARYTNGVGRGGV